MEATLETSMLLERILEYFYSAVPIVRGSSGIGEPGRDNYQQWKNYRVVTCVFSLHCHGKDCAVHGKWVDGFEVSLLKRVIACGDG